MLLPQTFGCEEHRQLAADSSRGPQTGPETRRDTSVTTLRWASSRSDALIPHDRWLL